jgi:hypothetical protein
MVDIRHIGKETKTLAERGLHDESYFEVTFSDGTETDETETSWSHIATLTPVMKAGRKYMAYLCNFPVKELRMFHEGLETALKVPTGHQVYQAVFNQGIFTGKGVPIAGRVVGLIKDGIVVEERVLNGRTGDITGVRF